MKIETENWSIEGEGIEVEIVTIESEKYGTLFIAINLDESKNSVYITSAHLSNAEEIEVKDFRESVERASIVETFPTLELAQQFYDEIKEPMKLSEFIKGRGN